MNQYIPVVAKITDIVKHTDIEWTFKVSCKTDGVLPGKFYEISIPKFGESPISVSGYGNDYIDFTIRNVGKVTSELFKYNIGDNFFIRGPYGNGFDVSLYEERDIVVDPQAEIYFSALQNLGNLVTDFYFFFTISRGDASG